LKSFLEKTSADFSELMRTPVWCPGRESYATTDTTNRCLSFADIAGISGCGGLTIPDSCVWWKALSRDLGSVDACPPKAKVTCSEPCWVCQFLYFTTRYARSDKTSSGAPAVHPIPQMDGCPLVVTTEPGVHRPCPVDTSRGARSESGTAIRSDRRHRLSPRFRLVAVRPGAGTSISRRIPFVQTSGQGVHRDL
jgi:hypothetical protein